MHCTSNSSTLSDEALLHRLTGLLRQSRHTEADLVAHIGEVDARRLYAREASPSMFAYCTEVLHLSEAEAYLRITVARASRQRPVLLDHLAEGRLHLSAIAKLAPHLTPENEAAVLERARHRSKRQIDELVAALAPQPDVPGRIRKLPPARLQPPIEGLRSEPIETAPLAPARPAASVLELRPDGVAPPERDAPSPKPTRATVTPLAPERYRVQFTVSAELLGKLERLQALMLSEVPNGDLAALVDRAVSEKLDRLEARRFARTRPRDRSKVPSQVQTTAHVAAQASGPTTPQTRAQRTRHIPAAVRRAVFLRDGDRCRYVDDKGDRCSARTRLEYHHRRPFALGGAHDVDNLSLLCPTHNAYLAERDYGAKKMALGRRSATERAGRRSAGGAGETHPSASPGLD